MHFLHLLSPYVGKIILILTFNVSMSIYEPVAVLHKFNIVLYTNVIMAVIVILIRTGGRNIPRS